MRDIDEIYTPGEKEGNVIVRGQTALPFFCFFLCLLFIMGAYSV